LAGALALVLAFASGVGFTSLLDRIGHETDAPRPGARQSFDATAYCKGTVTASGVAVTRGIAAADPMVLPPGTVVSLATGQPEFDGIYTVLDTGPLVRGRRLDLYVWSCHDALAFGRRTVEVTVLRLGWNPEASAASFVGRVWRRAGRRPAPSTAPVRDQPEAPDPTKDGGQPPLAAPEAEPAEAVEPVEPPPPVAAEP
jgi:3D (Asp-Asp-Asp) domain-containing protein